MGTLTYYDPITGQWITTDDEQTGGGVELYDGIIETRYIADLAVTDPKIASVSTSKLVGTISGTILDDNSIAWSKLDITGVGYGQLDPGLSQDIFDTQQTADGAHALAMGRNNIYYSATEPTAPIVGDDFNHGDMWVNLGDGKKLYAYDGTNWVLAQDEDIGNLQIGLSATASRVALSANGINKVYTQATMPTGGVYGIGDTWFAPDDKIYIFNGEIWYHNPVANPDGSLPIGDTGLDAYYQNTQPTGGVYLIGDKWFDTDDNYQQYTYTRDGWRTTADAYTAMAAVDTVLTVANGKNKAVYSQNAPTGTGFVNGDMWYRTGTNETTGDTGIITLYIYENGWKAQTLTDSVLGNITASRITVGVLNGNLIGVNTLIGDRVKANSLDSSKIIAGSITADSAIFAEGAIQSAWIGEAQINTAHINSIDSYKITAEWLEAGNIKVGALGANVIDVASLQVGSIAAQWGNALDISSNTAITVLARKDDLISYINVSPESIVINGDRVDINGALTLSNWADSNDVTKIDGGSIATNSITVNKVAAGFGQALDISSNTSITSRVTSTQLNTAIQNLVADIDVQYYLSTSAVTPTGGTWQSTAPPFEEGKYMWSRTKTTYQSGSISYEPSENGSMLSGATGQPGVGIQSIQEEYYSSTSATVLSGGSWSTDVPAWNSNRWIWTRSKINYTDGSSYTTNEMNSSGSQGPAGSPGAAGVSALNAVLSNEAATVPASSTGTVSTYNGSGTNINLYEGITELAYDGVGTANGSWKVVASGTGITPSTPTDGGLHAVYGSHSNMTADVATIVYTITGKRTNGTAFTLTKTQTLSKARAGSNGTNGTNGKVASIVPSAQVFKSSDGGKTFDRATVTLTPQFQVVTYQGWDYWNGTAWTAITSGTNGFTISSNVLTVPHTSPLFTTTNTSLTFRLRSNDANVYDTVTIAKLYDVADLQIGGKNIVVDSGYMFPSESSNFNTVGTGYTLLIDPGEFYGDNVSLRVTGASAGSTSNKFRHLLYGDGMVGRNMVLSFFVKGSVAATGSVLTEGMTTSLGTRTFPVTTSWTRVVLDMGSVTAAGTLDLNYLSMWFSAIGTFYLNSIKLEYGNKETEWSIAPQDMESQLSGLSGRISSAEQVITSDAIISRVRDTSWYQADLSGKASTGDVAAINTLLTNQYSTIEQTSEAISLEFGQLDGRLSDVETTASNVNSSFTFGANGLLIAKSDSAFKVEITNTALNFLQGTTPIAWVNGNSMFITDATITNSLKIGAHTVSSENGITTFRLA